MFKTVERGLLGPMVCWIEPGLVMVGFCIRDREATAKLGKVPRARRRAANDRRAVCHTNP